MNSSDWMSSTEQKKFIADFLTKHMPSGILILHATTVISAAVNSKITVFADNDWPMMESVVLSFTEGGHNMQYMLACGPNYAKLLESTGVINSKLPGCYLYILNNLTVASSLLNKEITKLSVYIFSPSAVSLDNNKKYFTSEISKKGLKYDSIHSNDFDSVISKWSTAEECIGARSAMIHLLSNQSNCIGIYDTTIQPPLLISWAVAGVIGTMKHLYTLKEYRCQGLGTSIIEILTARLLERGLTPHCHICDDNIASCKLFTKCGYIKSDSFNSIYYNELIL